MLRSLEPQSIGDRKHIACHWKCTAHSFRVFRVTQIQIRPNRVDARFRLFSGISPANESYSKIALVVFRQPSMILIAYLMQSRTRKLQIEKKLQHNVRYRKS